MIVTTGNSSISDMYVSHHDWLYGWLRRKLSSSEVAADLTQDTFVSILSRQSTAVSELKEPRAYLTTVAKCILSNYYQRQSLEAAYLSALAALPETCVISAEERLIILQTLQEIDTMLGTLSVKVRQAFLLLHLEGCKYAEIAARLNVSERTVKRYMAQAFEQCLLHMI
ncbi:putative RNA polymerase sigma factor FecI [Methylophilaceae bacterium]|nr:putative RNA polymerase sigma factor FecI [Methylophilaceae bacterium]